MSLRPLIRLFGRNNLSPIKTLVRTLCDYHLPPPHPKLRRRKRVATFEYKDLDPYALMKEDPIEVCSSIWIKAFSTPTSDSVSDLEGYLAGFDLWILGYQRTNAYATGVYLDRSKIEPHVLHNLLALRNAVVNGEFSWNDKLGQVLQSPNDAPPESLSKRKIKAYLTSEEPCFQDRVVQEVLLMILEPFFETRFSPRSHGFRPNRSAHTVIRTIRSNFAGYLWFLKCDLTKVFESLDRRLVMGCLEKVIKDEKILWLINSALKSPTVNSRFRVESSHPDDVRKKKRHSGRKRRVLNENEPRPDPYWLRTFFGFAPEETSKVPDYGCCGILSPLLANVCLHELDVYLEEKMVGYFSPSKDDTIWRESITDGPHNPSWPELVPIGGQTKTRKMDFIRYSGHVLIGIRGPRADAVDARKMVIEFCDLNLGIGLTNENIDIEHISRGIMFLDHVISRRVTYPTLRYTASGGEIYSQKGVGTVLTVSASLHKCIQHFRSVKLVEGDRDPKPLACNPMLYSGQAHTNAQMNNFLDSMAGWYKYADNRKQAVWFCAYVIRSSVAKVYASRYKLKSRAKVYGIASRDLSYPLRERSSNAVPEYSVLLSLGLVNVIEGIRFSRTSLIPKCDYTPFPSNWVPDHEKVLREYVTLDNPKQYIDLHFMIKNQGLKLPTDEMSDAVWNFKTVGVKNHNTRFKGVPFRRNKRKTSNKGSPQDKKIDQQVDQQGLSGASWEV